MRSLIVGAACVAFLLASSVRADDALKAAQETLKAEGFFLGEVDGKAGPDTVAALRRYQIRNGLEVTGELNAETAAALRGSPGPAASPTPAARSTPQPETQRGSGGPPATPRPRTSPPDQEADVGGERNAATASLAEMFRGTPYATAPAYVRIDVLRSAQAFLRIRGLYDGGIDGIPGAGTTRALADFQRRNQLSATGRFDMETLQLMGLAPRIMPAPVYRYYRTPGLMVPPPMPPRRYPPGGWQ